MDDAQVTIRRALVLALLLVVPFGQLIGGEFAILHTSFTLHPLDVLAVLLLMSTAPKYAHAPRWALYLVEFGSFAALTYIISLAVSPQSTASSAPLYVLRLLAYGSLPYSVWLASPSARERKCLFELLIILGIVIAVFGWYQYVAYPDLRALKVLGWDDHLYRLVSTYFDPAFTGILLVCTFLAFFVRSVAKPTVGKAALMGFLLLSIGFTYSRASFLALMVALCYYAVFQVHKTRYALVVLAAAPLILLLPRPGGSGTELERTHSIFQKYENVSEGLTLFTRSPLFGVGYNNVCSYQNLQMPTDHSCSGLDNSFLFVLATTGVVGILYLAKSVYEVAITTQKNDYGRTLFAVAVAVGVHSMFTNTLFYPWVMVVVGVLIGVSRRPNG